MKTIEWLVLIVMFAIVTNRCGKSIEERDWGESVAEFLFALGLILILVKLYCHSECWYSDSLLSQKTA